MDIKYIKKILEKNYGLHIHAYKPDRYIRYYVAKSTKRGGILRLSPDMKANELKIWYNGFISREKVRKRRR